jgi:hypothetical protein
MKLFDPRRSKKKAQDNNQKKTIREKTSLLTEMLGQICAGDNSIDEQKEIVERLAKEFGASLLWQEFMFSTEEVIALRESGGAGTSTTSICKILDAMKDLLGTSIGRITPPMIKKKIAETEKEALEARYVSTVGPFMICFQFRNCL